MSQRHGTRRGKVKLVRINALALTRICRQLGQLFMMGFDGTCVNDQIRVLIANYHVGSILLTAKNLECAIPIVGRKLEWTRGLYTDVNYSGGANHTAGP